VGAAGAACLTPTRRLAKLPALGLVILAVAAGAPAAASGQAWDYPSFQQPHVVNREFTGAVVDGGYDGTSFIFQWREQLATRDQFIFDGGFANGVAGHRIGFLGGTYGRQLLQQRDSEAIEALGTLGLTIAFGRGGTYTRVPLAISVGHRFPLSNEVALTPFVQPRVSLEFCPGCVAQVRGGSSDAGVGAGFAIGANLELSRRVSVRFATAVSASTIGAQDNAWGFGIAWSPAGLRRP